MSVLNIDLIRTTLEFVKRLRNHPRPDVVIDPTKGIPYAPIIWLSEQLGIEATSMYVYPTLGRAATKKRIYGNGSLWADLTLEKNSGGKTVSLEKLLVPMTSPPRGRQKTPSLIGYLGVARSIHFTDIEMATLRDAADFIGEYMYEIYAAHRRQQCQWARNRIQEMLYIHAKAGTLVRHVQGVVHRAIRAHMSYYCVIDGNNITVEYYQRHTWNRPGLPISWETASIPETFERLCRKEEYFQWIDIEEDSGLSAILSEYGQPDPRGWEYLIGVTRDSDHPIAALIFQFNQGQVRFYELYKDIISFAISSLNTSSRYLYQRRTSKLIVNPIFRGRETRIQKDFAFILMPFTAEWSNRIWKNYLKPILSSEGFRAIRANDLFGRDIMEDVWQSILQARVIIGDITGRNPNVFYELGIAHTVGKDIILLTQDIKDIPFDLNRYRHIIYQDNHDGYKILIESLTASVREIKRLDERPLT